MRNKIFLILICLLAWPALASAETNWQKIQANRAESYGKMMVGNLSYSHERSQKLYENIVLEVRRQNGANKNNVTINNQLLEVKALLDKNQTDLDKLRIILEPQNATKANWPETKKLAKTMIKDLRLSHSKIKKVLELLESNH